MSYELILSQLSNLIVLKCNLRKINLFKKSFLMISILKCHAEVSNDVIIRYENEIELNIRFSAGMSYCWTQEWPFVGFDHRRQLHGAEQRYSSQHTAADEGVPSTQ